MKTQVELKIAARMENLDLFLHGRGDTADELRMEARLNQLQIPGWLVNVHLCASEIRESDSGIAGRDDLLEPYRDHGIMWALNAYWRAREMNGGVYLEFETITLARSVEAFACKFGFVPVPQSIVAGAMDALPADSVTAILEGTRAECGRRASHSCAAGR